MADKLKTEVMNLMCQLTDDEQRMRGVELADVHQRLEELDGQKKCLSEQIKTNEAKRDKLATVVKYRQEERPVSCVMTPDFKADTMTYTRTDTMTVVFVRQLLNGERQQELPLEDFQDKPSADTKDVAATEGVDGEPKPGEDALCKCGHKKSEHYGDDKGTDCQECGCDAFEVA